MKTVSMLEFRRDAEAIIRKAQQGQRMILTYRGKPVLSLEPITSDEPSEDDSFCVMHQLKLRRALTNNHHFRQAGIEPLLV